MPARTPSRAAARCAVAIASSSETAMTSSSSRVSSTAGHEARRRCPGCGAGPGGRPESTALARGLDGHDPRLRVDRPDRLADAGDRPARPDAGDEARRRGPSSARRISGPVPRRWASGLAGLENWSGRKTSGGARRGLRGVDGLVHPAQRLDDLHARAVQPQQRLALAAHALRQEDREVVALGRADEGQRDAGVARGRLDDRGAPRLDAARRARRRRSSRCRCGP